MSTASTLATIADLEARPGRCELIHGEIVEMSPTGFEHGRSSGRVVHRLSQWAEGKPFEVLTCDPGFIWDEHTVRAPDVAVITAEQARQAPARGYMPFAPIAVVEVVSPSDAWSEVKEKVRGWLEFGVRLVWVVDPASKTVEIHAAGQSVRECARADLLEGGDALPGFACRVVDLLG